MLLLVIVLLKDTHENQIHRLQTLGNVLGYSVFSNLNITDRNKSDVATLGQEFETFEFVV